MKTKIILVAMVLCFFNQAFSQKKEYLSFQVKTKNTLNLYKSVVKLYKTNQDSAIKLFETLYKNTHLYGNKRQANSKTKNRIAIDKITKQETNLKLVSEEVKNLFIKYFQNNCCNCGGKSTTLFVRKIFSPQTFYSHLATPYRNESYVFYAFTDYDSITGFGRYFQTDAFYPRDAFAFHPNELCPDSCSRFDKLEFFTGIFYLTYDDLLRKSVINLLSSENDFNDRKEFVIDFDSKNDMQFKKAFEYKFDNYYPIVQGDYILEKKAPLLCGDDFTKTIFEKEYNELDKLNIEQSSAAISQFGKIDTLNKKRKGNSNNPLSPKKDTSPTKVRDYRDYFYPLKGQLRANPDSGFVYFGRKDSLGNLKDEAFYHYKNFNNIYFNNTEIDCEKTLIKIKNNKKTIKPFDILKMRNKIISGSVTLSNFNDESITGEADPHDSFVILDILKIKSEVAGDSLIWLKIQNVGGK